MKDFLYLEIYNNQVINYLIAFLIALITFFVLKITNKFIIKFTLKRPESYLNTFISKEINLLPGYFYILLSLYFAFKYIYLPEGINKFVDVIFSIGISFQVVVFISKICEYLFYTYMSKKGKLEPTLMNMFKNALNILLGTIFILMILTNLGIDIGPLIASLGVVSVSFAFAFKNILEDIFSAFTLYIEKPFKIGDFISGDKYNGTVKKIGLKTTHINSIDGQTVIVPNKDLINGIVNNYGNMKKRRIVFNFSLKIETPNEIIQKIPEIIEDIFDKIDETELDVCFLKEITGNGCKFEIIYFVLSKEYSIYADKQQGINIKIKEVFEKKSINLI